MKHVLVMGSTVVDVIIRLNKLPGTGADINIKKHTMTLGGCAYNVSDVIRHFQVPYTLFSPVGTGSFGELVRSSLSERGVSTPIPALDQPNGCCYCFVEDSGERTFLCNRGSEYHFRPEWFSALDPEQFDSAYLCGLELEEPDNVCLIDYLEAHPEYTVFFAPSPHVTHLSEDTIARLFALSPIIHLSEQEALDFSGKSDFREAAAAIFEKSNNTVIVTLGKKGAYFLSQDDEGLIPGKTVAQVDTIGAGDAHAGSIIACLKQGLSIRESIEKANQVSAAVVGVSGAQLSEQEFQAIWK